MFEQLQLNFSSITEQGFSPSNLFCRTINDFTTVLLLFDNFEIKRYALGFGTEDLRFEFLIIQIEHSQPFS